MHRPLAMAVPALLALLAQPARPIAIAPDPRPVPAAGEQYQRLVIRDAMLVNGRGTPAEGPVDIVIDRDLIADIIPVDPVSLHNYGRSWTRPSGDRVIDAAGMYVIPGLVDMHAHIPGDGGRTGPNGFDYAYKLWLAHGVTTLRDAGSGAGIERLREHRRLAAENRMVAPRLLLYERWPNVSRQREKGHTPEEARALVRAFKERGADGIKVSKGPGHFPDVIEAICDEVRRLGMNGVAVDLKVSETDAVIASNAGVATLEHWYGVPDAAIPGTQRFPPEYNYWNEEDRFRWAGRLWKEADQRPGKILDVLDVMIANGTVWDPTMVVYEGNRDLARVKGLAWHPAYAPAPLVQFWSPNPANHGSYHASWKTSDEIAWSENFRIWMKYVKAFFERGGTLTVGSDAGSLYALYGFSTIRELELLQEAGIHPIDIIKIATSNATQALGMENHAGVRIGHVADLAIIDGNPLDNFKVMYGTGVESWGADGRASRRGGVRWTIKSGIVYDAPALLKDVERYVAGLRGDTPTP
jgi:cytosine/adenosine deaminase-related metal-dependent hydrolase